MRSMSTLSKYTGVLTALGTCAIAAAYLLLIGDIRVPSKIDSLGPIFMPTCVGSLFLVLGCVYLFSEIGNLSNRGAVEFSAEQVNNIRKSACIVVIALAGSPPFKLISNNNI